MKSDWQDLRIAACWVLVGFSRRRGQRVAGAAVLAAGAATAAWGAEPPPEAAGAAAVAAPQAQAWPAAGWAVRAAG